MRMCLVWFLSHPIPFFSPAEKKHLFIFMGSARYARAPLVIGMKG